MAKLVPLTVCYSIPEAHVLTSTLRARGLYSIILALHHGTLSWTHLVALGGLEIHVLDVELDEARAVFQDVDLESGILTESESFMQRPWDYTTVFYLMLLASTWYPLWLKYRRWKSN